MMDFEVQKCTRHCAQTERQLEPGESYFTTLTVEGADVVRRDYSAEAWQGPPDGVLGWWKSQMPDRDANRMHWAPNDVMLHLLDELEAQPELADMRYVLALLLVRRRVLRLEEHEPDESGGEQLELYCPRQEKNMSVPVVTPTETRIQEIQDRLAELLFAKPGEDK